jgi:hypothetical protein
MTAISVPAVSSEKKAGARAASNDETDSPAKMSSHRNPKVAWVFRYIFMISAPLLLAVLVLSYVKQCIRYYPRVMGMEPCGEHNSDVQNSGLRQEVGENRADTYA